MSGGSDKTEKPTAKRLSEARKDGQVVRSPDFISGLILAAGASLIIGLGSFYADSLTYGFKQMLYRLSRPIPLTPKQFLFVYSDWLQTLCGLLMPFTAIMMLASIAGGLITTGLLWSTKPLMPALNKLNPLSGVKRLFSVNKVIELAKGLLKLGILTGTVWGVLASSLQKTISWADLPVSDAWLLGVLPLAHQLMLWGSACLVIMGTADWRFQAFQYEKRLRMSRQEVIDEHKQQDGDPKMKGKIRRFGRQLVEKRQLLAVPKADVIVNNPTHVSVAIQYDPDVCPAPRVIAKGQDYFALKIREVAAEHKVPMVENKLLARSLYQTVEVDRMIPAELFVAVAEVLAYVFSRNKGRRR